MGLFVGDLSPAKGVAELMDLIPRLADRSLGWVIVGKGALLETLQARIAAREPGFEKCRVLPYLDFPSLVRSYQNADFFFFPTHAEGSPTVLIEAIACGLPVLASDIPPNHDAVNAGENGGFFPVGDLAAMEQAILGLLPVGERLRLGEASRAFALRFFDQEAAARELIAAITSP